jgi:hypothetical protein
MNNIERKLFQFRYRNWWKSDGCGWQISFLPQIMLWHEDAWCLSTGWLGWCFEFWINASIDLV